MSLLGPRATASPCPTPPPAGSSRGRSLPCPCTLDPSLSPEPLSPRHSPGMTSPPQCPHRSLHGRWDGFGQGWVVPRPGESANPSFFGGNLLELLNSGEHRTPPHMGAEGDSPQSRTIIHLLTKVWWDCRAKHTPRRPEHPSAANAGSTEPPNTPPAPFCPWGWVRDAQGTGPSAQWPSDPNPDPNPSQTCFPQPGIHLTLTLTLILILTQPNPSSFNLASV